jgi:methyl halide transferase
MQSELSAEYWQNRYQANETGWDLGEISTPIKEYIDQLTDKNIKILIPGCGNAYEAEYLWKNGFKNIFIADYAPSPLDNFKLRVTDFPESQLLCSDFFQLDQKFNLIIEQTFFCAINPELRAEYAQKVHELLESNGTLVGLLFNDILNTDKPPFGGNAAEYKKYFEPYFRFEVFETAHNSIKPRFGRELFMNLKKK